MDEGLSKKRGAHISGRLKNYMRWPIAMAIMLLLLNLWIYCIDIKAGTVMLIFLCGLYAAMTQKLGDGVDIHALLQKARGIGMAHFILPKQGVIYFFSLFFSFFAKLLAQASLF